MNRLEPNLLLCVSTGIALVLLLVTATVFGEPGPTWRYPLMAAICATLFVALQAPFARLMKQPARPPMIHADAPSTTLWASILPLAVMIMAAIPVFFSGYDYGLLIIIAAIVFGQTVDSTLKARRAA